VIETETTETIETDDTGATTSTYRSEKSRDSGKPVLLCFSALIFAIGAIAVLRLTERTSNQEEIAQLRAENVSLQRQVNLLNNQVYALSQQVSRLQPYVRVNVEAGVTSP
jgi:uncharacterized protein YlxW (UPF0749 family)